MNKPLCWKERILYESFYSEDANTIVFFGGIHGNEVAGYRALQEVFVNNSFVFSGNVYAFWGNKRAIQKGIRFVDFDLNRLWGNYFSKNEKDLLPSISESRELLEIESCLTYILARHASGKVFFMDLHTTSSESSPFLPFNDSLQNRALASKFPVPLILGVEEYIQGSLMSYLNDLKCAALAFEAGMHTNFNSKYIHKAFVLYSMHQLNIINLSEMEVKSAKDTMANNVNIPEGFYEILYRHEIRTGDNFIMKSGYLNFVPIKKGELLADHNGEAVYSPFKGRIFMPSYQSPSSDGFFIIRKIPKVWLWLSKVLRGAKISAILPLLPGVSKHSEDKDILIVNPRVAFVLQKQILHLLGYRVLPDIEKPYQYWVKRD